MSTSGKEERLAEVDCVTERKTKQLEWDGAPSAPTSPTQ